MATMAKKGGLFCFLDVDVDDQIGRYANCKEFVKKKNLTYGLQSNQGLEASLQEINIEIFNFCSWSNEILTVSPRPPFGGV